MGYNKSVRPLSMTAFFLSKFGGLHRRPVWRAVFWLLCAGILLAPSLVFAQDDLAVVGETAGLSDRSLLSIIGSIISVFLSVLGVIALCIVIYAGYLWMTAGGDAEKVGKAKKLMINAAIGLVIILSSFAIVRFIMGAITGNTDTGNGIPGGVPIERLSGSLGSGAIRDHYPQRNATDVPRNTRIIITFRDPMNIPSFIEGYDTADTPTDRSDDTVTTAINTNNIRIYPAALGPNAALEDVSVAFTDDLRTFVFDPAQYLGSPDTDVLYTVALTTGVQNVQGRPVFSGTGGGYQWSFTTGTLLDLTPPTIESALPMTGGTYDRNIAIQVTFSEAVDPTSASGIRAPDGSGFDNIQTAGTAGVIAGEYAISNGYQTVTFVTNDACGTNSCGETIYCLPGGQGIDVLVAAATVGDEPPQALGFPYDGVADVSANSLDGDADGVAGDDFAWDFSTTNLINLVGPVLGSIAPNILEEDVPLDQPITLTFSDVLLISSVNSDGIALTNEAQPSGDVHELWYRFMSTLLDSTGAPVVGPTRIPASTRVTVQHGTFLASSLAQTYLYGVIADEDLENQYQNCYVPAAGPSTHDTQCAVTAALPYCCNGVAAATACALFP